MSDLKNQTRSDIGGATSRSVPLACDCPCHSSGNTFPCGGMCWHPGVDQFGLPLSYDHASVTQLLKATLVRGIKDERIESELWEALFLSATEAASGVHTPVAANDALNELRRWLGNILTEGE